MKSSKLIKKAILLFMTSLVAGLTYGQKPRVKIGDKVLLPTYHLVPASGHIIDTGKIIVLDFWATWCGPCIAAFPILDSLQAKYGHQIQVVAVSDERLPVITKFLTGKNNLISIFTNQEGNLFKDLGVEARPTTCILSKSGELIWVSNSEENLDLILDKYLKTGNLKAETQPGKITPPDYRVATISPLDTSFLYCYRLSLPLKGEEYSAKVQHNPDLPIDIKYTAVPVSEVIEDLLNIPSLQFINKRRELDSVCVDISAKSTSKSLTYRSQTDKITQDLKKLFDYEIIHRTRIVPCYRLKVVNSAKLYPHIEKVEGGGFVKNDGKIMQITRLSLAELAGYLQRKTKTVLLFEGTTPGKFNLEINNFQSIPILREQLLKNYGLDLVSGKAKLAFYEMK